MTINRAIEVAIREMGDQIACEDITPEIREELTKATQVLKKFLINRRQK